MNMGRHVVTALSAAFLAFLVACGSEDRLTYEAIDVSGKIDVGPPDADAADGTADGGAVDAAEVGSSDADSPNCPTGLEPDEGVCVSAVPADPTIEDDEAWRTFGAATVTPGRGLVLGRDEICQVGGSGASTNLSLGDYDDVGPLVVSIDLEFDLCDDPGFRECDPASTLYAKIGESVVQVPTPFGLNQSERSVSFCLPTTAYGAAKDLTVWFREFDETACTDRDKRTIAETISSVRIERSDPTTCPAPGDFPDAGFERDFVGEEPIGWDVNTGGTGQIAVDESSGDQEAILSLVTGCSNAQMRSEVRIPAPSSAASGVALRFEHRVSTATPLQVRLGPLQRYVVGPSAGVQTVCVPSYLWGRSEGLLFRVTGTTDCSENLTYEAAIDDLEFVELVECGPAGEVRDGGFDGAIEATWNSSTGSSDAAVENVGESARLATSATCGAATLEQWVTPRSQSQNALSFRYRATPQGDHSVVLRPLGRIVNPPYVLAPATEWTEQTICLPGEPRLPVSLSFTEFASSMTCGAPIDTALELDDVRLVEATGCGVGEPATP